MSQTNTANRGGTDPPPSNDTAELQRDIAEARDELAAAVAALAAKTDVKARAQDKLQRIRMRGRDRTRQSAAAVRERGREIARPGSSFKGRGAALGATAATAAVVGWLLIRRRHG
jgi:chromosome segregation ATPase